MPPTPISLIIDDATPGIHLYQRTAAGRDPAALTRDGRPLLRFIPNDFLREFIEVCERYGIKGKFSVVPRPANEGSIRTALEGVSDADREEWLALVREWVVPRFDLTPEMITHHWALDLATMTELSENEHDWSQHQDEASLTEYIAFALRELRQTGLDANGVTSPWAFGRDVEDAYARAVLAAQEAVYGRSQTWFFLAFSQAADARARIAILEPPRWCVHIVATCDDFIWPCMDTPRTDAEHINEVADHYLTADGQSGRMAELLAGGGEIVICTHWQSLFANGTHSGLRALEEVARRVAECCGERVQWLRCSEIAELAVVRAQDGLA